VTITQGGAAVIFTAFVAPQAEFDRFQRTYETS
jgi:hypothetical protein